MRVRWLIASLGLTALVLTTIVVPPSWRTRSTPPGVVCPIDAKTAKLDFRLKDVDGKTVTLADYRGKVLLLDFWATWCPPCRVEIPGFVNLYAKYRSQGFEVVGVVVQDPFEHAKPFADRFGMNYTIVDGNDRDDLEAAFPTPALPTSFLINREGKICSTRIGLPPMQKDDSLEDAVEKAFENDITSLL